MFCWKWRALNDVGATFLDDRYLILGASWKLKCFPVFSFSWLLCFISALFRSLPQSSSHTEWLQRPLFFFFFFLSLCRSETGDWLAADCRFSWEDMRVNGCNPWLKLNFEIGFLGVLDAQTVDIIVTRSRSSHLVFSTVHSVTSSCFHNHKLALPLFLYLPPALSPSLSLSLLCTLIQIYQNAAWPLMPQLTSCSMCFSLLLSDTKQLFFS